MNTVTSIEKQKNNPGRVNIFIDYQFSFSCDVEILATFKISVGSSILLEDMKEIILKDNIKRGFNHALSYLSYQSRSRKEILDFLQEKGYDETIICIVITKLEHYGYINDQQYAQNYIQRGISQKKGAHRIKRGLKQKGISDEIQQKVFLSYSFEDEHARAFEYAKQYCMNNPKLPLQQMQNKLATKLNTKGYSWEVIKAVVEELNIDPDIQQIIANNEDAHREIAFQLAQKLYKKYNIKNISPYQLKSKIFLSLQRRGFTESILKEAIYHVFLIDDKGTMI